MPYTRPYPGGFIDYPDVTTPITASVLNTMDVGIKTANDQFQTVTTAQRTALSPTVGQAVWDSDLKQLMVYMNASGGNAWQPVGNRIVCASTTRPSTPFEGQEIYETDTDRLLTYNGSAWVGAVANASVSSLPASPVDGQIINYEADATNGVIWQLRYRSASASSYKWEFVGGSELQSVDLNSRTVLSAAVSTFVTYTGAPSITAPLAGDYAVMFGGALLNGSSGNSCNARIGVSVAAGAVTYYGSHELNTTVLGNGITVQVTANLTGVTASQVIDVRGGSNGFNHTFRNTFLRVRPVRVG